MPETVTQLLADWNSGDRAAAGKVIPIVYSELRRLARAHLRRERPGHTLQTTALVHEAFLKLVDQNQVNWRNRAHFFAIAAELMRRILVDYARGRLRAKRGGGVAKVTLDEIPAIALERPAELIALDDALTALALHDPRKSKVVELRFFGGLSVEEVAGILEVSENTVIRDWSLARAWLAREIATRSKDVDVELGSR